MVNDIFTSYLDLILLISNFVKNRKKISLVNYDQTLDRIYFAYGHVWETFKSFNNFFFIVKVLTSYRDIN